jgi:fructokinase
MHQKERVFVGLGELLWDCFATGNQIGGAPANFAYHSALLGNHGVVAGRVGRDELGVEAISYCKKAHLTTGYIQTDPTAPTGTTLVRLDGTGQPDFTITDNVAWDNLEWTSNLQTLAQRADAVCFGSLAQRNEPSRSTIRRFIESVREDALKIFDVNLRQGYYTGEVLSQSLRLATVAKLNEQELPVLTAALGFAAGDELEEAETLREAFELEMVCLTRGDKGSMLVTKTQMIEHAGFQVPVVDTVGAGDAFTAALAHSYLHRASLQTISETANRVGAWVASRAGAMPQRDSNYPG